LREEAGYTLFELLTVLVIMGVVLSGLTTSFAAGLNAEAGTIRRAQAQQNARLALDRMRIDIHCASGAPAPQENPYGGFTLTLTESPNVCPAVTTSSSGVQWCTIPYSGSTTHWQLFRYLGTQLSDCGGGGVSTLLVDYVTLRDRVAGEQRRRRPRRTGTAISGQPWRAALPAAFPSSRCR
jgi:prepilin-type N-terminal cleavage/methylation domain-containing protein